MMVYPTCNNHVILWTSTFNLNNLIFQTREEFRMIGGSTENQPQHLMLARLSYIPGWFSKLLLFIMPYGMRSDLLDLCLFLVSY